MSLREWLSVRSFGLSAQRPSSWPASRLRRDGRERPRQLEHRRAGDDDGGRHRHDHAAEPEAPEPPLEDGRHFGYIHAAKLTDEPRELVFDLAYFLTGDEANKAAEERGFETPSPTTTSSSTTTRSYGRFPSPRTSRSTSSTGSSVATSGSPAIPPLRGRLRGERAPGRAVPRPFSAYWLDRRGQPSSPNRGAVPTQ